MPRSAQALPDSVAFALLQVWGDEAAIKAMPIKQQAFLTAVLLGLLQQADGSGGVEDTPGLTGTLLSGISARLGNPIESLRCATVPQHRALPHATWMCAAFMLSAHRLPDSMSAACARLRSLTLALHSHCLQVPILTWATS